jgi:hypothetical protein
MTSKSKVGGRRDKHPPSPDAANKKAKKAERVAKGKYQTKLRGIRKGAAGLGYRLISSLGAVSLLQAGAFTKFDIGRCPLFGRIGNAGMMGMRG